MEEKQNVKAEALRYIILAVQRHGNRILNDLLKSIGLTASQAEVLRTLRDRKGLSLKELGQLLICESGSPSRLVERLVRDGLVEKIAHSKDSRYVTLQLTQTGKEKEHLVENIEKQLYGQLNQAYSEEELELMCTLLGRFLKGQPITETLKKRGYWN
ncbi:MarR family transcriptional regulator [Sporolactobacillus shoreae]|uniref:MarR family transcriptional regulator n=1 Tax=Sporolactobacillus shoreae TaxID=1465501 RepID=A0A4Z0GHI7_9BACL|nr:winged helix DNA-binding protein [Sporolactobacillus shoreae]TGA96224.1 MarR family transcriptional regulator [Sporolactobacillus shoreae]